MNLVLQYLLRKVLYKKKNFSLQIILDKYCSILKQTEIET